MWCVLSQGEAIGYDDKPAAGAWMRNPAKINVVFEIRFGEFAMRPIAHGRKGTAAFLNGFDSLVPSQRRMIRILVLKDFSVALSGLFHLRIIKGHFSAEQILPTGWSYSSEKGILEEL